MPCHIMLSVAMLLIKILIIVHGHLRSSEILKPLMQSFEPGLL
uniref:Uncharacterized protein n=1 Tax=Arundo donax TaxID=35708 RepID=A0A0A8YK16_ARUDO